MKKSEPAPKTSNDRAPMCNICIPPRRHWGREPHQFKRVKGGKK